MVTLIPGINLITLVVYFYYNYQLLGLQSDAVIKYRLIRVVIYQGR